MVLSLLSFSSAACRKEQSNGSMRIESKFAPRNNVRRIKKLLLASGASRSEGVAIECCCLLLRTGVMFAERAVQWRNDRSALASAFPLPIDL